MCWVLTTLSLEELSAQNVGKPENSISYLKDTSGGLLSLNQPFTFHVRCRNSRHPSCSSRGLKRSLNIILEEHLQPCKRPSETKQYRCVYLCDWKGGKRKDTKS